MKKYCLLFCLILFVLTNVSAQKYIDFKILYTNDNHGWIDSSQNYGGAADMYTHWKKNDHYKPRKDKFLVLSGGDLYTGPALSSWFHGNSTLEVLNAMKFDAVAVGNHEFDITVDSLRAHSKRMNFPLLAANIIDINTDTIPDYIKPYAFFNVNKLKIAIIGLACENTPNQTFPKNVKDYKFIAYQKALKEYLPEVKQQNPDIIMVLGHIGLEEAEKLVKFANQNDIPILLNGHYHENYITVRNGVYLVQAGCYMQAYTSISVRYDVEKHKTIVLGATVHDNTHTKQNKKIANIVNKWKALANEQLLENVGYCTEEISMKDKRFCKLICKFFTSEYPEYTIGFNNMGGMRQGLKQGEITKMDILGVMPFDNKIAFLDVYGRDVIDASKRLEYCGFYKDENGEFFLDNGEKIKEDSIYKVVTTDYLFQTNYALKKAVSSNLTETHYTIPVFNFLKKNVSKEKSINVFLNEIKR
ncbi:MAG: bifunctional metallophosphatase/5'-nucleotidase [Bacteroidales bacterium]|nr:bifunctional metallophosphatase/5'-nucleotidase [Bacteroidales bacterium]